MLSETTRQFTSRGGDLPANRPPTRPHPARTCAPHARRGAAAALAMIYLVLFATLSLGMYAMSTLNMQAAANFRDVERARGQAEAGLRFLEYRFSQMPRPRTTAGNITPAVASALWPQILDAIDDDVTGLAANGPQSKPVTTSFANNTLTTTPIYTDTDKSYFTLSISPDPLDPRILIVRSTGVSRGASRTVSMDFRIDKKINYAIVGKVPIQLGRNTLVEGPVAMTTGNKFPPVFMLSDFKHLTTSLGNKIENFNTFLKNKHNGYDNRIDTRNTKEMQAATASGYSDYSNDGFIDEYDLFLREFDKNGDRAITRAEFTNPSTGKLYDDELFSAIDSLGAPMASGDAPRAGYQDGVINAADGYAKIRGQLSVAASASAWATNAGSGGIQSQVKGPIVSPNPSTPALKFGAGANFDLDPDNFDTTTFKNRTGAAAGLAVKTATRIENVTLSASDANATAVNERTPYGSTAWQATYKRPVFKNVTFKNVRIPRGLNALFDNCKFEGTTFVELATDITTSTGQTTTSQTEGMKYAQKMKKGSFSKDTALTVDTSWGFANGNNLRFNDCTVNGPIASDVPTAYTHFANSMEFTGATRFDNQADDTATIVCPQTNIEMGSFTDPTLAPSTLVGVVVAGNLDIRGTSNVDGSIIITGDGAGSTTQGWFGPSDASTETSSPMPEGGWGKINIRYNPTRALPDGINVPIDIVADPDSYTEAL